jgi:hypothetical protein
MLKERYVSDAISGLQDGGDPSAFPTDAPSGTHYIATQGLRLPSDHRHFSLMTVIVPMGLFVPLIM